MSRDKPKHRMVSRRGRANVPPTSADGSSCIETRVNRQRRFPADPDQDENERKAARFHIGGERYAFVKMFRNVPYVNIREYFYSVDSSRWIAGKKGLNLTEPQWEKLKSQASGIDVALAKFKS